MHGSQRRTGARIFKKPVHHGIDLAFVCMNLPFTMDAAAAASAVAEFGPKYVYPYHYRGRDGGTQDPAEFASLVGDAVEVKMGDWYPAA